MEVIFKIDATASKDTLNEQKSAIDGFFNSLLGTELKVVKGTVETTQDEDSYEEGEEVKYKPAGAKRAAPYIVTESFTGELSDNEDKLEKKTAKKAPAKKPEPEQDDDIGDEVSFEELSSAVAEKIKELKDSKKPLTPIKKKLTALGADKLDDLDEEHYGTMLDFINKL